MSVLSHPRFHEEAVAYEWIEARVWPNGPICPHCGSVDSATALGGKSTRLGVYKCRACRKPFTVKVGTIFESSHVPLHKWLQAIHLLCCSKKGISSHQLHRLLGVTLKTAWFMSHRVREAMRDGSLGPLGGEGKAVEADETYFGKLENPVPSPQRKGRPYAEKGKRGPAGKRAVVASVERGGSVRSYNPDVVSADVVGGIVRENIARESNLMTDESRLYGKVGAEFASHETVMHSAHEYVRGEVHTNTIEGVFSIFKRGMKGVYQHCREKHLHRYLAEFDFRYNNRVKLGVDDAARAEKALLGVVGKRLTYKQSHSRQP